MKLVTVLTMTFFLLLDGGKILDFFLRMRGPSEEERLRSVFEGIYRSVAGYVAGNLLISFIAGGVTYITLMVLGVPFAAPLAVLMGFLDLIPLVGATIGGIVIGAVTAFTDFPTATIVWVIVLIVYQQVENNLLQPFVYRRTVQVAPLLTIVAVLIGATLLGVLGVLIAIPIAAAIQIVVRDVWDRREPSIAIVERRRRHRRDPPARPGPPRRAPGRSPEPVRRQSSSSCRNAADAEQARARRGCR